MKRFGSALIGAAVMGHLVPACSDDAETSGPSCEQVEALVVASSEVYEGKTLDEWAAEWWRWQYAAPCPHPNADTTGEQCGVGQDGPVYFLAGTFGGVAKRRCDPPIPAGKAILFPILCLTVDNACYPSAEQRTDAELEAGAQAFLDNIVSYKATVDGCPVEALAFHQAPYAFTYTVPVEHNVYECEFGADPMLCDGDWPSYTSGKWILLEPLEPGEHHIVFEGEVTGLGAFTLRVDTTIVVE